MQSAYSPLTPTLTDAQRSPSHPYRSPLAALQDASERSLRLDDLNARTMGPARRVLDEDIAALVRVMSPEAVLNVQRSLNVTA